MFTRLEMAGRAPDIRVRALGSGVDLPSGTALPSFRGRECFFSRLLGRPWPRDASRSPSDRSTPLPTRARLAEALEQVLPPSHALRCAAPQTCRPLQIGIAIFFFLIFLAGGQVWACPGCKEAIQDGAAFGAFQAYKLARGFNASVFLMLGMPFLLTAGFVGFLLRAKDGVKS